MKNAKQISCFVASPSDTQPQRNACDSVIDELNRTVCSQLGIHLKLLTWEKNTWPAMGESGQQVINEQIGNDYDIFLAIFYNRYGTPTALHDSGTEEEIEIALNRFKQKENVQLMFFFNTEKCNTSEIDIDQLSKVRNIKERVSDEGALYREFDGTTEFESKLREALVNDLYQRYSPDKPDEKLQRGQGESNSSRSDFAVILEKRVSDALKLYSDEPTAWVEPILQVKPPESTSMQADSGSRITLEEIVESKDSFSITSPPQFGLTCAALKLSEIAWKRSEFWPYVDADQARSRSLRRLVEAEAKVAGMSRETPPDCIVLDAWVAGSPGSKKLITDLFREYPRTRVILFRSQSEIRFYPDEKTARIPESFVQLYLLAQPRTAIRSIVENYNSLAQISNDNDAVLNKIVSDLDTLNIHRTPANCVTLLRASERFYDDSPVNRTMLLEMVLRVLFDTGKVPIYQTRPDVKDCEQILGMFSEHQIRKRSLTFSQEFFSQSTKKFCEENLLNVNCDLLFDILFQSRIIIQINAEFAFKSSYWLMYFGARRMLSDSGFCVYVMSDKNYVNFPLIVEFYAGSDRRRNDLVDVLTSDLKDAKKNVEDKTGLLRDFNPFERMTWTPSDEDFQKMESLIGDEVLDSNLPTSVKDTYADRQYDFTRPYRQSLGRIMTEYSVVVLMQSVKASARALRNSEYIRPESKRKLLGEISHAMQTISRVVFAITPMLARDGRASIEGQGFNIVGEFGSTFEDRIKNILVHNAVNVVGWFSKDIFSPKMGPLFLEYMKKEESPIIKHHHALLIVSERPENWRKSIESYIEELKHDSFYLYDLTMSLQTQYKYSFVDERGRREIGHLIKSCMAKHSFRKTKPTFADIKRISNSVLPEPPADA